MIDTYFSTPLLKKILHLFHEHFFFNCGVVQAASTSNTMTSSPAELKIEKSGWPGGWFGKKNPTDIFLQENDETSVV